MFVLFTKISRKHIYSYILLYSDQVSYLLTNSPTMIGICLALKAAPTPQSNSLFSTLYATTIFLIFHACYKYGTIYSPDMNISFLRKLFITLSSTVFTVVSNIDIQRNMTSFTNTVFGSSVDVAMTITKRSGKLVITCTSPKYATPQYIINGDEGRLQTLLPIGIISRGLNKYVGSSRHP